MNSTPPLANVTLQIFNVNHTDVKESKARRYKVLAAKIAGVCIASMGRIGFFPLAKSASDNALYGTWLGIANMAGFGAFYSWTNIKIIDDFTAQLSEDELALLPRQDSQGVNGVKYVVAFVGGAISLVPLVYITVQANNGNWGYGAMCFISDVSLPTLSLRHSFVLPSARRALGDAEKEVEQCRKNFVGQLQLALIGIQQLQRGAKDEALLEEGVHMIPSDLQGVLAKVCTLKAKASAKATSKAIQSFQSGSDLAWLAWGSVTAISNIALLYLTTIAAVNTWRGDDALDADGDPNLEKSWLGHLSAVGVSAVNTVLLLKASVNGARRVGSRIAQLATGRYQPTIEEQMMPRVAIISNLVGAAIAGFAYGPTSVLGLQYFSRFKMGGFMQVSLPFGVGLLIINSAQDITNDVIRAHIAHGDDDGKRKVLELYCQVEKLLMYVQSAPLIEFAKFANSMQEDDLREITDSIETLKGSIGTMLKRAS